ncbi:MAG: tetratricopeptide repeat-containing protein [Rhodobiaceae bacterium]|nr:tetratricopeptide repeat-containing protein [Rhodobiaceae bacterium]MCC0042039.1 tetratricopeptide repeat-containing protein [Rhodobiaceae bacterium]
MSEQPTSASSAGGDIEMRAALAAGWKAHDLDWERLQEQGNACFEQGDAAGAARAWRRARWIAMFRFALSDPRRATTLANLALLDRVAGHEAKACARYRRASRKWERVGGFIETMNIARRARSSLFHLRMEARHWDTYTDNTRKRFAAFAAETARALDCLAGNRPVEVRLFGRWRGEKPSVFDDTRKFLSAALLIGGGAGQPGAKEAPPSETRAPPDGE